MKIKVLALITSGLLAYNSWAQDVYNYNQNFQINEFVKEGGFKLLRTYQTADGKKTLSQGNYTLTKIDLGYQDSEGYEVFALQMIRGKSLLAKEDTIYLMPDNKYYPTHLEGIRYDEGTAKEFGKFIILNGGEISQANIGLDGYNPHGSYPDPMNYVIYFEKDKPEFVFNGKGGGQIKDRKDFMTKLNIETKIVGGGFHGSNDTKVTEYPGVPKLMETRNAYLESMIETANSMDYDEELSELINDNEYLYYESNMIGYVDDLKTSRFKLVAEKDANGNITSLKVHKPFTDGKFYDKEKFFVECSKNQSGQFLYKGDKGSYILIPFDGYIVGAYQNSGAWVSSFVLTNVKVGYPKLLDSWAHAIASSEHSGFSGESSAAWWCKTELEEKYDKHKDQYYFRTFFTNYVKALMK